jgi:DNA-binding transcriptional LysR family regulator
MIDLTRLKAFIFSAETMSFSEASHLLQLSQPTISHHIKTLEKNLGVILFERRGNQLVLTEAGNLLLPWARKLIRQSNEIREMMMAVQDQAIGHLRIACSVASGKYVLPHLAMRFRERFPEVQVSILPCAPRDVTTRLIEDQANLALVSSEMVKQGFESQTLFTDTVRLIVPKDHPFTQQDTVIPGDLLKEKFIMREPGSGTRAVLMTELSKHDMTLDDLEVLFELGNAEGIVQSVAAGYGVSFVSELLARDLLDLDRIRMLDVEGLRLVRQVFMVRRTLQTPQRVTDAFWSFVHNPANQDLLPNPLTAEDGG